MTDDDENAEATPRQLVDAGEHREQIGEAIRQHVDDTVHAAVGALEVVVNRNAELARSAAVAAAAKVSRETGTRLDELAGELRGEIRAERRQTLAIAKTVKGVEASVAKLLVSVVELQSNNLRMMGVGSLLGAIVIYVGSRALGA